MAILPKYAPAEKMSLSLSFQNFVPRLSGSRRSTVEVEVRWGTAVLQRCHVVFPQLFCKVCPTRREAYGLSDRLWFLPADIL